jgi:peptidoglycan/LPS O-acetylase OafA/YrhL
VDLFFVISGFVIALPVFAGRSPTRGKFIFARLVRIYPMAILTTVLFGAFVRQSYPDPLLPGFFASALLLPSPFANVPVVIWSLKQEVLFYILFLLVLSNRKTGFAIVFAWCLASLVQPLLTKGEAGFVWGWLLNVKNVEFGIGILACKAFMHTRASRPSALLLMCLGSFLFLSAAYLMTNDAGAAKTLALGGSAALLIYAMACLRLPRIPLLLLLGNASYSIYLIHLLAIALVGDIAVSLGAPLPLAFAIIVLAGITTGLMYHAVFERPLERWRKARQAQWFAPECSTSDRRSCRGAGVSVSPRSDIPASSSLRGTESSVVVELN